VLPTNCEDMNATAFAEASKAIEKYGLTSPIQEVDLTSFNLSVGPVAQATMTKHRQVAGCRYPVYLHNVVEQWVAEVAQTEQATLIASLRADATIAESELRGATVFSYTQEGAMAETETVTYLFIADVWVAIVDNGALDYTPAALDGVLAANPGLA